jgi:uncharacterized Ntn-hydrolase superfamily protein
VTYSIVARDPETGALGVAVQSRVAACASTVLHAEAGVGAVATQSLALRAYGPRGLHRMRAGEAADSALASLVAADERERVRQVAFVDAAGRVAAHTGAACIAEAGHRTGEGYSVQANMMARNTVWDAMAEAYEASRGDLAERLLAALDAAQAEGGDVRGQQGGGILVVPGERDEDPGTSVLCDVRVDDHPEPLRELRRVLEVRRAYDLSNQSDDALERGDHAAAVALARQAVDVSPDPQVRWSLALALAAHGDLDAARRELDALGPEREAFAETARRLRADHTAVPLDAIQRLVG